MGARSRRSHSDSEGGAPEWMVTFSDCMTLLLTFFVLLLSFSSFDVRVFRRLKQIFSGSLSSVSPQNTRDKDAFLPTDQVMPTAELDFGSEKPTLQQGSDKSMRKDTEPAEFRRRRVFLIRSEDAFWGRGAVISLDGRKTLLSLASFLKEVPEKVVISEGGRPDAEEGSEIGLERAWAVGEYLTSKGELDPARLNIAVEPMAALEGMADNDKTTGGEKQRWVEICVLERRICR